MYKVEYLIPHDNHVYIEKFNTYEQAYQHSRFLLNQGINSTINGQGQKIEVAYHGPKNRLF